MGYTNNWDLLFLICSPWFEETSAKTCSNVTNYRDGHFRSMITSCAAEHRREAVLAQRPLAIGLGEVGGTEMPKIEDLLPMNDLISPESLNILR